MSDVQIQFPDGSVRSYESGSTGYDIAKSISPRLAKDAIAVKVDGDLSKLWRNWSYGLHRQTVYGDITKELRYFCKFKGIDLVNEAV